MQTAGAPISVSRQIAFFAPADNKGKWHAAWLISQTPVCGANVTLDQTQAIRTQAGNDRVHPIVCRRCMRLSLPAGVSATGMTT